MTPGMTIEEANPHDIDELRARVKGRINPELYDDDNLFVRFLRARNSNIDAAEAMLKKHLVWRKVNKIDRLLTDYTPPEVLEKYIPMNFLGCHTDGTPVIYVYLGNVDSKGVLKSASAQDIRIYIAWIFEKYVKIMKEETAKRGYLVDKLIIIVNLENLALGTVTHKPSIEAFITIVQMYDANFPERLKAVYAINTNAYFMMAWTLVRPFLTGRTFQKIHIFGKTNYQDVLLKEVNENCVPGFLGGKLTDPDGDPNCKTIVGSAGTVPERYFKKNISAPRMVNATKLVVHRMAKAEVEVMVLFPGSSIEWEFEVKNRDIAFSLIKKGKDGEEDREVVEKQRISTTAATELGILKCDQAGTYFLQFDNSYSWLHSKEILYAVSIVKPIRDNNILPN